MSANLESYLGRLHELDEDTRERVKFLTRHLGELKNREKSADDFIHFVQQVWPAFILGSHHKLMAKAFTRTGKSSRPRIRLS